MIYYKWVHCLTADCKMIGMWCKRLMMRIVDCIPYTMYLANIVYEQSVDLYFKQIRCKMNINKLKHMIFRVIIISSRLFHCHHNLLIFLEIQFGYWLITNKWLETNFNNRERLQTQFYNTSINKNASTTLKIFQT